MSPYAQQASDVVSGRVGPYAQRVSGVVGPYAKTAKQRGARVAYDAVEKLGPALEDALDKVPPAVEIARTRMRDEVLPRLAESLAAAAAVPVVVEAAGAVENGAGATSDPKRRWLKRLIVVVAIGGIAAIVARKLLSGSDKDRQAARPTAPDVPGPAPTPSPATSTGSDLVRGNRPHLRTGRARTARPASSLRRTPPPPQSRALRRSPTQLESELGTIETAAAIDADEREMERGGVDAEVMSCPSATPRQNATRPPRRSPPSGRAIRGRAAS